jgi:pilus assembly protein CpaF
VRYDIEEHQTPHHLVSSEDLDYVYSCEIQRPLTYYEQLDILATIVFTRYKGFGCIDTLREQNIDGINMGVSGAILSNFIDVDIEMPQAPRSIWIYYEGKYIHLDFLTTYTEEEMRRIIVLLCMYNNPGALTEKRGYLVNTMYDKTRILAARPGAGEYWAVFLRKFNLRNVTLESLYIKGEDMEKAFLPVNLIKWLMVGRVTCAFTGRQAAGKTTAMIAAIAPIDARLTIRVLELAPEMYLRERYPDRNIYSVSETQYVSAAELQDALKKSDGAVSIVGEVATDAVAARMIQMGQVASMFTIFSHHANRAKDLINAITNSVVATSGGGATALTVQPQVVDVIKIDVHMDFTVTGFRYFERITEIIPVDKTIPPYNEKEGDHSINKIMRAFFEINAVNELFTTQDIIRFDKETNTYVTVKWLSKPLTEYMLKNIPRERLTEFQEFVTANWKE